MVVPLKSLKNRESIKDKFTEMNKNDIQILKPVLFISLLLVFGACNRDNNYTVYSNAFDAYSSSPLYSDSMHMMLPVEGTVPRSMIPYQYDAKSFDEQQRAGRELVNPMEPTKENLERGKAEFEIYCAMCHGTDGRGDGHLFTAGLFPAKPTSLRDDYVQSKPDGEIFHVITRGSISGLMGSHASQIKPDDRWRIVTYVKNGFVVK